MGVRRYGQAAANQVFNKQATPQVDDNIAFISARVLSIILDESHPRYQELGGEKAIGYVEIEIISPPSAPQSGTPTIAQPLFPNISNYPIINEIIFLLKLPNPSTQTKSSSTTYYYFTPINLWNTVHTNPLPNPQFGKIVEKGAGKTYDMVETGFPNVTEVIQQDYVTFLGNGFNEKANIRPLMPYIGDVIHQGRWGNSLRFGSTFTNNSRVGNFKNNWSEIGTNGDPIIIIRNGQYVNPTFAGYNHITENINLDDSSIYMTSTQQIPVEVNNTNYDNYNEAPESPNLYSGKQIILNSGRLIFNAKEDHLLLSSEKSIGLNTNGTFNVKSYKETIISSPKIYLGSKIAIEPVLLGNQTVKYLENLINALITLVTPLTQLQSYVENQYVQPKPNTEVRIAAKNALEILQLLVDNTEVIKSTSVKTI